MKLSKEKMEMYASKIGQTPEEQVNEYLSVNCEAYKGNEDKLERCITHLNNTVRSISKDGKNTVCVPDMVAFLICQDYFNEEMWKAEDEEAAKAKKEKEERDAKAKAEKEKAKKAADDKKKAAEEAKKVNDSQLDLFGGEKPKEEPKKEEDAAVKEPEKAEEAEEEEETEEETEEEDKE